MQQVIRNQAEALACTHAWACTRQGDDGWWQELKLGAGAAEAGRRRRANGWRLRECERVVDE